MHCLHYVYCWYHPCSLHMRSTRRILDLWQPLLSAPHEMSPKSIDKKRVATKNKKGDWGDCIHYEVSQQLFNISMFSWTCTRLLRPDFTLTLCTQWWNGFRTLFNQLIPDLPNFSWLMPPRPHAWARRDSVHISTSVLGLSHTMACIHCPRSAAQSGWGVILSME